MTSRSANVTVISKTSLFKKLCRTKDTHTPHKTLTISLTYVMFNVKHGRYIRTVFDKFI